MKQMKQLLFGTLLFCVTSLSAADYFPLANGNTWTYRENATGQSFTVRVGTPVFVGGRTYYSLNGYVEKQVLARYDDRDQLMYYDEERGQEFPLTLFTVVSNAWWAAPFRQCEQEGQVQERKEPFEGPAGRFPAVLTIRYRSFSCADAGVESEQYAENIGMLRRRVTTFAGPRTFELASARIGNQTISSGQFGRFTVSVPESISGDKIPVTLTVDLTPGLPLTLRFASSQEYDLRVKDAEGRTVYMWSADKLFLQAVHDKTIDGSWTVTVDVPTPNSVGRSQYSVEAWLTTMAGNPQFAATAPFSIPTAAATPRPE